MADSNPKFNREAFKKALAHVESSGGKFLENSSSSAVGKYQFLWNNIKSDPSLKGVTKRQFIDSPELQEKIMDSALNGNLKGYPNYIENSRKLQEKYGSSLRVDEIALLTHFLGSGGVQKQLETGAYEVPGVNMSVDGYTGKYNKFLQDNGGAKAIEATGRNPKEYQGPQNDADLYAQQAASIGMDNQPSASQPQANPFTAEVNSRKVRPEIQAKIDAFDGLIEGEGNPGGLQPMPQKERPQPANILPEAQSVDSSLEIERNPVKSMSASRVKSMLSPKETDYKGFQNLSRPTDNITESNDYSYGGYVKQNKYVEGGPTDPVKGKTAATSTTGATETNTSITPITGPDGNIGSRRTRTTTTPINTTMETPYTQAGNEAYGKLDQQGQAAQDKAWTDIQNKNRLNSSTEVDETYSLNLSPMGLNPMKNTGTLSMPNISDGIQNIKPQQEAQKKYYVSGSNMHNKNFGGHSTTQITDDAQVIPGASYTASPGNTLSGMDNKSTRRELTPDEVRASNTGLGKSWNKPIPSDIGNEMIRRDQENLNTIVARNESTSNKRLANKERIAANQAAKQAERQNQNAGGGMIKRADGSYSKRGLWDNIRANKGSGKKPTAAMLKQERKINNAKAYGGSVDTENSKNFVAFEGGGTHEQNSLGGIPQGTGSNGKMNTVEEGETKVTIQGEEYIFSERGQLDGTGFEGTKSTNSYAGGGDPMYSSDGLNAVAGTGADAIAGAAGKGAGGGSGMSGMGAASAGLGMVSMGLDMVPEKNSENNTGVEGIQGQKSVGLGAAKGAASGAAMGAVAGPWGMAAGAVIGGAAGALKTSMGNKKAREENLEAYAQANPALQNQNYGGGYLKKKKKGGKMLNPSTKKSRVKAMLRK